MAHLPSTSLSRGPRLRLSFHVGNRHRKEKQPLEAAALRDPGIRTLGSYSFAQVSFCAQGPQGGAPSAGEAPWAPLHPGCLCGVVPTCVSVGDHLLLFPRDLLSWSYRVLLLYVAAERDDTACILWGVCAPAVECESPPASLPPAGVS